MTTAPPASLTLTAGDLHASHVGRTITLDATVCGNHTHISGILHYLIAGEVDGARWATLWLGETKVPVSVPFTHPVTISHDAAGDGWEGWEVTEFRKEYVTGSRYLGSTTVTWIADDWVGHLHVRLEPVRKFGPFATPGEAVRAVNAAADEAFTAELARAGAR